MRIYDRYESYNGESKLSKHNNKGEQNESENMDLLFGHFHWNKNHPEAELKRRNIIYMFIYV